MNAVQLATHVAAFCREHAAPLGLAREAIDVAYVPNAGGFVNFSYRIRGVTREYHLKLAASRDDQDALRRWKALAPMLEPYHAPPILDWVDVGPAAGLLFPIIDGAPPPFGGDVVEALTNVLTRLNADRALAEALATPHPVTARDGYRDSFHRRFVSDLGTISASPPPFVNDAVIGQLSSAVDALRDAVERDGAFDEVLTTPIHGDLWLNNVLWSSSDRWYLIDWDDLRIGDAAADVATLTGPSAADLAPLKLREVGARDLTAAQRSRLDLLGRATLLDWAIDPLADWIDADVVPGIGPAMRAEKERLHRGALRLYWATFG
jgi:hypothetical protein